MENEIEFLTAIEFARALKVTRETVYAMIKKQKVKAIRLFDTKNSEWRIPKSELQRMHAKAYLGVENYE